MKKTFLTTLVVLFIACFLKMNFFIAPVSQAVAQVPRQEREEPLPVAIKKFMEREADQKRRAHAERERDHQVEQHKHQIENLHLAARHLEAAGVHDIAHQIHNEAKIRETKLREHIQQTMHHQHVEQPQRETHELLHQIKHEMQQLKMEMRELREAVSQRAPEPGK